MKAITKTRVITLRLDQELADALAAFTQQLRAEHLALRRISRSAAALVAMNRGMSLPPEERSAGQD